MPASTPHDPQAITATIINLIAEQKSIPADTINSASTFAELQMDSLDKINLSFEVEEAFKITIPDDALDSLKTVSDIVAGVQRLQAEQPSA